MNFMWKILALLSIVSPIIAATAGEENYLDIETPNFFQYNSPLKQPDSLRSRPYFDFLSTLYRRDATKSDLFRPYTRAQRSVPTESSAPVQPIKVPRTRRAIVFRPLFVYKQQQIKKQDYQQRKRL